MSVTIRQAAPADVATAYGLVRALAEHEGSLAYLKISEEGFAKAAFSNTPSFRILIAELDGTPVGIATYIERFHIWSGQTILELDDLFVKKEARGHGIGTRLLRAVGACGKDMQAPVKWQVNTDNIGAIKLYKSLGVDYSERGICFWRPENIG